MMFSTTSWAQRYRAGEVIVKLKSQSAPGSVQPQSLSAKATNTFFGKAGAKRGHMKVMGSWAGLNMHQMKVDEPGVTVEDAVSELEAMDEVEYAEPNWIVDKLDVAGEESGQFFSLPQVLSFLVGPFGMTGAPIEAHPTWPVLTDNNEYTTVAIIDTGIDLQHTVFNTASAGTLWVNAAEANGAPGVDDDLNGYVDDVHGWNFAYNNNNPDDDEGHGTHVAGIVLGTGLDIFNINAADKPKVRLMALKFLASDGSGATSDAIKAIYYAVNNGARVLNNSWGGGAYSHALAEAIAYSYQMDALFVAAAGNARNNNDIRPTFPANYEIPNVISVAATDDWDNPAYFTNYGNRTVHVASPGVGILSSHLNNNYAYLSGTSMAAPFVSGIAALMRHETPAMNNYQTRNLVISAANFKAQLNPTVNSSARVNVLNGVNLAKSTPVDHYKPGFALGLSPHDSNLSRSVASRGGGCGLVGSGSLLGRGPRGPKGPGGALREVVVLTVLLMIPFVLIGILRKPDAEGIQRRRHDRYEVDSQVTFKVGDRQLVGSVRSISVGGSDLNTEELLEQGSTITMSITSPDGETKVDVQGHVVWSEEQKRYGVAFDKVPDAVKAQIGNWTTALKKI